MLTIRGCFIVDIPLGNVHLSKNEMEVVDTVEDLYSIHRSKIEKIDNVSEFINIQLKDNEERSVVTNKKMLLLLIIIMICFIIFRWNFPEFII